MVLISSACLVPLGVFAYRLWTNHFAPNTQVFSCLERVPVTKNHDCFAFVDSPLICSVLLSVLFSMNLILVLPVWIIADSILLYNYITMLYIVQLSTYLLKIYLYIYYEPYNNVSLLKLLDLFDCQGHALI